LSESEARKVSKELNTPINKFPRISKDDAAIAAKGPQPGQLVAIKRNDPTGKYTYYRVVSESV
jgi:DNA-directed RNA polymerase subunit H (RpoH/RPB5)